MIISQKNKPYFFLIIFLILPFLFPAISLPDAQKVFRENSRAVVVVVAFDKQGKPISQGSGFVVKQDGAIVTNYHVISNAVMIKVKAGNKVLKIEGLIYTDKENDLVILKAVGKNLSMVKIGDVEKLSIGEKIYVIGNPEGLENTISDGILSGIREIEPKRKILQITAPISKGSSGGPVFNKNGEVIGIATFLIEEAQNLNFAMPVNLIKDKFSIQKVTDLKDVRIEDYQNDAEYWFMRACYYYESGSYREAVESLEQAIRIKPDLAVAHNNLGAAYTYLGMWREAIESCKQAIRIKPDIASSYKILGVAYDQLGMYREAIESYEQAIRIKPDYAMAHYGLSGVYGKLGRYREAIEASKQAIRIKPDYVEAHNNLGIGYIYLGMYREAIASFKRAIRIKPDYAVAHYNLGAAYGKLGMHREAIESYEQAIRIKPDYAEAYYGLGGTYLILKDRGSAIEKYKTLKSLDPELANKLFNLIYK